MLVLLRAVARTASDTRVLMTVVRADDRADRLRVRAHPGTTWCATPVPADGGGASVASAGAAETTNADATAGEELVSVVDAGLLVAYVVGDAAPVAPAEIPSAVARSMLASASPLPEELTAAGCGTAAASSEKTALLI